MLCAIYYNVTQNNYFRMYCQIVTAAMTDLDLSLGLQLLKASQQVRSVSTPSQSDLCQLPAG